MQSVQWFEQSVTNLAPLSANLGDKLFILPPQPLFWVTLFSGIHLKTGDELNFRSCLWLAEAPGIARVIGSGRTIPPPSGLNPCSTCTSCSTRGWSCLNTKLADLTHFAGSRDLCWPRTLCRQIWLLPRPFTCSGVRKFTLRVVEEQSVVLALLWSELT